MTEEQLKAAESDATRQEVAEGEISEDDLEGVAGGTYQKFQKMMSAAPGVVQEP